MTQQSVRCPGGQALDEGSSSELHQQLLSAFLCLQQQPLCHQAADPGRCAVMLDCSLRARLRQSLATTWFDSPFALAALVVRVCEHVRRTRFVSANAVRA